MSAGGPSDQRVTSPEAIFKWLCSVEWVGTIFSRREFVPKSTGYQPHGSKRPFYHPALRQLSGVNGGWALAKQGGCWRRVLSVAPNMGAGGSHPQATRACTWSQKRGGVEFKSGHSWWLSPPCAYHMSAGCPSDQRVTSPEAIFKWLCSVEWVGTIFSRGELFQNLLLFRWWFWKGVYTLYTVDG